jgi:toxin ParE1/3/4
VKVRYSRRAVADLNGIADYLITRSPQGTRAVEAAIRITISLVADFPRCGRIVAQRRDVRVIPVTRYPYLVFYTVTGDTAVVLHIRHATREPVAPNDF